MKTLCISQPMTPSQIYSTLGMTNTKFLFMSLPLLAISFILFYAFVTRLYLWLRYKLPPGPSPLPIIGNLYNIIPDRALCFEKWSRTYGPIISVWLGSTLNVVVSSPGLAKEVLKDKDESLSHRYRNHPTSMMTSNGKNLIWADYGTHFVKVKKICVLELFSPKSVEALRPIREDEVRAIIESIYRESINQDHHGRCLVLRKYLSPLAFNTITRFVLGKRFYNEQGEIDIHGLEFKAILGDELRLGSSLALVEHVWWLSWIYWFSNRSFSEHLARRNHLIGAIIEECKVSRSGNGVTKQSFVDVLLGLQERHGLSKDTMVGLLWDMITAGMDTTAIVVEWAMAQLVKNPMILHKAQHELDQVIGPDRTMTETDILNLPYLQCITKETLRLHPPTPLMLPHKASTHVKVGGYDIPKNTNVYVNVIAIGRDPTIWRDPIEFRPERFLEEDVDIKGHDFRALPFGSGRRMCPAAQLGINMVSSVIGNLLHHFNWSLPHGVYPMDIDMIGTPAIVNYMRTPLEIVPTPRLSTHFHNHNTMNV